MIKRYKVDLKASSLDDVLDQLKSIQRAISSSSFKEEIKNQCVSTLEKVMEDKDINNIENGWGGNYTSTNKEKVDKYKSSNHSYIEGDTITLYNDAYFTNDELTHFFNEDNRDANYDGFSIANLVEYGSGLSSSLWVFKGDSEEDKVFTRGSEGKYIYHTTTKEIDDNICDWVTNYLDREIRK